MNPRIFDKLVSVFGSQAEVAAVCNKTQTAFAMWKKRGRIPTDDISSLLAEARTRNLPLQPNDFFEPAPAGEAA